jgi:hypothetical protein
LRDSGQDARRARTLRADHAILCDAAGISSARAGHAGRAWPDKFSFRGLEKSFIGNEGFTMIEWLLHSQIVHFLLP